jgi:uncharacterized protein
MDDRTDPAEFLAEYLGSEKAPATMPFIVLDGYLTGVLLAPGLVMPSMWLNEIWGEEPPPFSGIDEANTVIGAIMGYYNDLNKRLSPVLGVRPEEHELPFDEDELELAEAWSAGFLTAVAIAAEAWEPVTKEEERVACLAPMLILGGPRDDSNPYWEGNSEDYRRAQVEAIELLPMAITVLAHLRHEARKGIKPGTVRMEATPIMVPVGAGKPKRAKRR